MRQPVSCRTGAGAAHKVKQGDANQQKNTRHTVYDRCIDCMPFLFWPLPIAARGFNIQKNGRQNGYDTSNTQARRKNTYGAAFGRDRPSLGGHPAAKKSTSGPRAAAPAILILDFRRSLYGFLGHRADPGAATSSSAPWAAWWWYRKRRRISSACCPQRASNPKTKAARQKEL